MLTTLPIIPSSIQTAPDFSLSDHTRVEFTLESITGSGGVLLGFLGDIWKPITVHRIFGLQRHAAKLALLGWPVALVVRDRARTLENFHLSSPLPVPFPLLADADGRTHEAYRMNGEAGLLLIDSSRKLRYKWLLSDETVLPPFNDIVIAVQSLQSATARGA